MSIGDNKTSAALITTSDLEKSAIFESIRDAMMGVSFQYKNDKNLVDSLVKPINDEILKFDNVQSLKNKETQINAILKKVEQFCEFDEKRHLKLNNKLSNLVQTARLTLNEPENKTFKKNLSAAIADLSNDQPKTKTVTKSKGKTKLKSKTLHSLMSKISRVVRLAKLNNIKRIVEKEKFDDVIIDDSKNINKKPKKLYGDGYDKYNNEGLDTPPKNKDSTTAVKRKSAPKVSGRGSGRY